MLSIQNKVSTETANPKLTSGGGAEQLISTMFHEWYFNNVLNASENIITIPDTGTVGGLNISNPALTNKPTASTIGTKISYTADGTDDYLYTAETNFMRSMPTWMITLVFKYDSSGINRFFSMANETSANFNGIHFSYNNSIGAFLVVKANGTTQLIPMNTAQALVNGTNYIFTFSWDGTNLKLYKETTQVFTAVELNPIAYPTATNNIVTFAGITPVSGNFFGKGNIAYMGVDEYDLTRLNANVATLKSTFGI